MSLLFLSIQAMIRGGMDMAQIRVNNLTFYYDGSFDDIFENATDLT